MLIALMNIAIVACNSEKSAKTEAPVEEKKALTNTIGNFEKQLVGQVTLDRNVADSVVSSQVKFAEQFPNDPAAPNYLFRAGDVSQSIGEYAKAIELWETVRKKYPSFNQNADALFKIAFCFDEDLRDKINAKKTYEQFLQEYPRHPLAEQVNKLIPLLDRDPEEVVKEFENKTAKDSAK